MADYAIQSGLERIADGIKKVAEAWAEQNKIERDKVAMELGKQKREWREKHPVDFKETF